MRQKTRSKPQKAAVVAPETAQTTEKTDISKTITKINLALEKAKKKKKRRSGVYWSCAIGAAFPPSNCGCSYQGRRYGPKTHYWVSPIRVVVKNGHIIRIAKAGKDY